MGVKMASMTIAEARDRLEEMVERAGTDQERIVLMKGSREVAALVPIEDLRWMEELEEREDLLDAEASLRHVREHGGKPLATLKAELGL